MDGDTWMDEDRWMKERQKDGGRGMGGWKDGQRMEASWDRYLDGRMTDDRLVGG